MEKLKKILFYLGCVLFVFYVIHCAFFESMVSGATKQAVPVVATSVHQMKNIDELLKSPVCGQINKKLGGEITVASLLKSEPWLRQFVPSEVTVVNMPICCFGQKTWAIVSWVGWRSPWLRWKLGAKQGGAFKRIGKYNVWSIWEYTSDKIAPDSSITCSLTDNLFILCISDHPSDIISFLDAYDGVQESIASIKINRGKK